jgi:hypothetical protein
MLLLCTELIASSCPRIAVQRTASLRSPMSRASTSLMPANKDVDGRNKSGHDELSGKLDSLDALWMSAAADVLYLPAPADVAKW